MTRPSAFLLVSLLTVALAHPDTAQPAAAAPRARPAKAARTARKPAVRPITERSQKNDKLIATLERKQAAAEKRATREVSRWSDRKLARFGFRTTQRDKATRVRTGMIFGRNDKRLLTTARLVRDLLAAEASSATADGRALLQEQQATLMRSGLLNRKLGTEKQWWRKIKRFAQGRFPRFSQRIWFLRRDTHLTPGTVAKNIGATDGMERTDHLDPIDSSMWKTRKPERITSESLFHGPWMKPDERPTLPESGSVLELENVRSLDADGVHPSVFVTDPATGTEWKVKFVGDGENPLSSEAVMSRFYYALGYHSSPVYHVEQLTMDPRAVIAAYDHKQRVGFRVSEHGFLHRLLGVRPGKYGISPYKMRPQIRNLKLKGKGLLHGEAAYQALAQARRDPSLLDGIEYVTMHGVDLALKAEGGGESIGPFHPDDPGNVDRREMRGLSFISAVWAMGDDVRFNNVRLDADVDDGVLELKHVLSDAGAHFQTNDPNAFAWEVDIDLARERLHNDNNRFTIDAYDRATFDDARWAARKLGALSEGQITAIAAAGSHSWPVARLYAEKLIARRDDMVKKLGLHQELGLLRPHGPDRKLTVSGPGKVTVVDARGVSRDVEIPAGAHKVVAGQVVAAR